MAKVREAPAGGEGGAGRARPLSPAPAFCSGARLSCPLTCEVAAQPQFPLKEGLPREEPEARKERRAEEDSALKLCVPKASSPSQSPLRQGLQVNGHLGGCAAHVPPTPPPAPL